MFDFIIGVWSILMRGWHTVGVGTDWEGCYSIVFNWGVGGECLHMLHSMFHVFPLHKLRNIHLWTNLQIFSHGLVNTEQSAFRISSIRNTSFIFEIRINSMFYRIDGNLIYGEVMETGLGGWVVRIGSGGHWISWIQISTISTKTFTVAYFHC